MAADSNPASSQEDMPKAGLWTDLPASTMLSVWAADKDKSRSTFTQNVSGLCWEQGGLRSIMGEKRYWGQRALTSEKKNVLGPERWQQYQIQGISESFTKD